MAVTTKKREKISLVNSGGHCSATGQVITTAYTARAKSKALTR